MQLFGSNYYLFCNFSLPIYFYQYVLLLEYWPFCKDSEKAKKDFKSVYMEKKIVGRD